MKRTRQQKAVLGYRHWAGVLLVGLVVGGAAEAAEAKETVTAFLQQHCLACHDASTKSGNLDLEALLVSSNGTVDAASSRTWIKIHDRVIAGEMPPKQETRPEPTAVRAFSQALAQQINEFERQQRRAGRVMVRRLNRREYENTLRDLFDMPGLAVADLLPDDGRAEGYNKLSAALDLSSVHLAKYMEAADVALEQAIAHTMTAPERQTIRLYPPGEYDYSILLSNSDAVFLKDFQYDPRIPLISDQWANHGEMHRAGLFQIPGTVGLFRHQDDAFQGRFANFGSIFAGYYKVRFSIWGFWWNKGQVEPSHRSEVAALLCNGRVLGHFDAPSLQPTVHECQIWLQPEEWLCMNSASLWWTRVSEQKGRAAGFVGPGLAYDWLEIEGPIISDWPPTSHRRLFGDLPLVAFKDLPADTPKPKRDQIKQRTRNGRNHAGPYEYATVHADEPPRQARELLAAFLTRAFRRPVAEPEIERYVALVLADLEQGACFEDAMRTAYRVALCAPDFLFLVEPEGILSDWALADRLSYMLWNSQPDDTLRELAATQRLHEPDVLRAQTERLLADPRANRFVEDFLDQWLDLREIDFTTPDRKLYPEFSHQLRVDMLEEPRAYFRELLHHNLSITHLVDSDFAMLNQKLAELYEVSGVLGTTLRKVALPANHPRGGFLTQAAILKITANGTTTSPVKRGAWVQRKIVGQPPEPPPPNIPAIEPDLRGATTVRELLAQHRADPACAGCHAKMDPPGFALESFDVIGGWRDRYRALGEGEPPQPRHEVYYYIHLPYRLGRTVDSTGQTADGIPFENIHDFKRLLLAEPRQLARNFVKHLLTYGTGAAVTFVDRQHVEQILDRSAETKFGIRTLLHEVIQSELFRTK